MKVVLFLASHAFALKTAGQWAKIKSVVRTEVGREPDDGEITNLLLNDDWAKGCGADFVRLFAADGVRRTISRRRSAICSPVQLPPRMTSKRHRQRAV